MATEKRLIDVNEFEVATLGDVSDEFAEGASFILEKIDAAPTVDAVPVAAYDQVRWERDVAIEQLESYGVSLGEKAEVAKVVRCRDCKHQRERGYAQYRYKWCEVWRGINGMGDDGFCNYGERKDDG